MIKLLSRQILPRPGLSLKLRSQSSSPLRSISNKDFCELTKAKLSFNNALMAYSGFLVGKF